ncbi:hypothetical protein RXV88_21420 [Aestuariicoccus sp. MJ-SS9]|nr:hypothetical protein [Aestuariicoccus sp. MJ-SS9]
MWYGRLGLALRFAAFLAMIVAATWTSHLIRDALDLQMRPENEQRVHRAIMLGSVAYVGLLALPFVPGAEIGIALLTAFGADIAPLIYVATVVAMVLSYSLGRLLRVTVLIRLLMLLRMRRAAALVARAAPLPREARLATLMEGAPPRTLRLILRHRYVGLALAVKMPGKVVIGGGGGIMMLAGLSGVFAPLPLFLALAIAVSPVPLVVMALWR